MRVDPLLIDYPIRIGVQIKKLNFLKFNLFLYPYLGENFYHHVKLLVNSAIERKKINFV